MDIQSVIFEENVFIFYHYWCCSIMVVYDGTILSIVRFPNVAISFATIDQIIHFF